MLMISRVTLSRAESIFIGLFGKRKTRNLLNISDSIWKNAIGKRERQIERGREMRGIFSWLNSALFQIQKVINMRIYCFNQEFISCSTNGNDPTPNKTLLTRSIYGWDDVRPNWRPPSQSIMFLISIQCLTLRMRIYHSQTGTFLSSARNCLSPETIPFCPPSTPSFYLSTSSISFQFKDLKIWRFFQFHKTRRVFKVLKISKFQRFKIIES